MEDKKEKKKPYKPEGGKLVTTFGDCPNCGSKEILADGVCMVWCANENCDFKMFTG
jgi:ribosomal protein S27AE